MGLFRLQTWTSSLGASQSGPPVLQHSSDDAAQFGLGLVGHGDNVLDLHRVQGVGQAHVRDDGEPEYFHAGVDRDQDLGNGRHSNHVGTDRAEKAVLARVSRFGPTTAT